MADQLAVTLTRIPAHSDSEQGTGNHHEEIQEDSLLTDGTLTMQLGDAIETVRAPVGARVAPGTTRSQCNDRDKDREVPFPAEGGHARNRGSGPTLHRRDPSPATAIGQPEPRTVTTSELPLSMVRREVARVE